MGEGVRRALAAAALVVAMGMGFPAVAAADQGGATEVRVDLGEVADGNPAGEPERQAPEKMPQTGDQAVWAACLAAFGLGCGCGAASAVLAAKLAGKERE